MKKQVLSTLALCTCLGVAQAQTDVTSQYLVNPSFEENVSYTADAQATNIKTENKIQNDYADNGWERTSAIVDWGISATVAYGTPVTLNETSIPATAPEDYGTAGLAILAAWSGSIAYQQDTKSSLPAGLYKLQCNMYNIGGGDKLQASNFGFITDNKNYLSNKTSFTKSAWDTEEVAFYLTEPTSGKIQVGIIAQQAGSGSQPLLIYDNVKLYKYDNFAIEEPLNFTGNVGTAQASWAGAGGAITVGGIPVVEKYSKDYYTGNVFSQTISNLPAGVYRAELYANASAAIHNDGGDVWERKMIVTEGDNTCTIASVNGVKIGLPIHERTSVSSPDIITFNGIEVTEDGTLTISIDNEKEGANWIIAQIKSLVYYGTDAAEILKSDITPLITEARTYVDNCPAGIASIVNDAIEAGEAAVSGSDISALNAAIETLNNAIELAKAAIPLAEEMETLISTCQTNAAHHSYAATNDLSTLQAAIAQAQSALTAATTTNAIAEATSTLEAARQAFVLAASPEVGYPFDYSFLASQASNSAEGWTKDFDSQNFAYKTSTEKNTETLEADGFVEIWNPNNVTGTLTYTQTALPNGHYKVSAYAFTCEGGTTSFIVKTATNDESVAMNNTNTLFTQPTIDDVAVTDGTMTFGLNIGDGVNWAGITHIQLEYPHGLDTEVALNITDAGWATLILPFAAEVPQGLTAYTCAGTGEAADGVATLNLTEADALAANTPYIVKGESGFTHTFEGLSTATKTEYTSGILTGTLVEKTAETGTYVLQNQDSGVGFYKVGSDAASQPTIGANRVYLNADAVAGGNVQAFILKGIDGDGTTTGIDGTVAEADATVNVYNLNGILVRQNVKMSEALDGLQKGIYIVNGTKKAVK